MTSSGTSLPKAPGLPIVGNLPELRRNRVEFLERLRHRYGNTVALQAGPVPTIVSTEPADVRTILVERAYDFHKAKNYRFLGVLLGEGLLTSEDELHRSQRRLMAPSFTPRQISNFADTFVACAREVSWDDGQVVDVVEEMSALTLEAVNRTLFGSGLDTEAPDLGPAFLDFNRWVVGEAYRWLHLPVWLPLPRHRRLRNSRRVLQRSLNQLVARRRHAGGDADLLSTLLAARDDDGNTMSDAQLKHETLTLMFAGHETTALALSWAFYLLARHADVRAHVEDEVDGVLAGRPPRLDDLRRLPYTLQVITETMRLYPPAPVIGRMAQCDVELADYTIPAGTLVACSIYGIHHRADLWPDPEAFRPERFAPDRDVPQGAYIPFAAGPRVCIGNHFAMMEAHLILADLVQRVRLDLVDSTPVGTVPLVTLHPDRRIMASATTRAA